MKINAEEVVAYIYKDIGGYEVKDLLSHEKFPDNFDDQISINTLDHSSNLDKYGVFVRGYFVPSESGTYKFHLSGDDSCSLVVRADKLITANFRGWSPKNEWNKYSTQESEAIELVEGKPYYFELIQKEHYGGDHFQIGWSKDGGAISIITEQNLKSLNYDFGIKTYGRKFYVAGSNLDVDIELGNEVGSLKIELFNSGNSLGSKFVSGKLREKVSFKIDKEIKGDIEVRATSISDSTSFKKIVLEQSIEGISVQDYQYYYTLDGTGDGVVVDKSQALHGKVFGSPEILNNGVKGESLLFDGKSDYLKFYPLSTFPAQNEGSMALWAKTKYGNRGLVYHGDIRKGCGWTLFLTPTGRISFESHLGSAVGVTDLRDDSWKHVVVTFKGKAVKVYVDSILEIEKEFSEALSTRNYRNFFLGVGYKKARFKGQIDEVKYFNNSLTKSQIEFEISNKKDLEINEELTTKVVKNHGLVNLAWESYIASSNIEIKVTDVNGKAYYDFNVSGNVNEYKFDVSVPEGMSMLIAYLEDDLGNKDSTKITVVSKSSLNALDDVLLSHYPLDEQIGSIAEDEVSSQEASIFDIGLGEEGAIGGAFEISYSSKLQIKQQPLLYGNQARSISLWLKSKPKWDKQLVLRYGHNTKKGLFLIGTDELGRVVCDIGGQVISGKSSVRNNLWNHIVVSYESKKLKIFVNGEQEASVILDNELNSRKTDLYLGGRYGRYYNFYGTIDDIRTYKTSFDENDVKIISLPRQDVSMSIAYLNDANLMPNFLQNYKVHAWSNSFDVVAISLLDNGDVFKRIESSVGEFNWSSGVEGEHNLEFIAHLGDGSQVTCRTAKINIANTSLSEGFLYEKWNDVTGSKISDLKKHSRFPGYPDVQKVIEDVTSENSSGSNFGARYRGIYEVQSNGWYQFAVTGDDQVRLYYNQGEISFGQSKLAEAYRVSGSKEVEDFSRSQFSKKIYLEDGQKIFIEILQKESWGSDFVKLYVDNLGEDDGSVSSNFELIENVKPFDFNRLDFNIISLANNAVIEYGSSLVFSVEVLDNQGDFSDLRILVNGLEVDGSFDLNSTFVLSNLTIGENEITVQANDQSNNISEKSFRLKVVESLNDFTAGIRYDLWNNVLTANYIDKEDNKVFETQNTGIRVFDMLKISESVNPDRGQVEGYVVPKESGEYQFSIAGGGRSQLFLEIDGEHVLLAQVQGSAEDNWTETQEQISDKIYLEKDQKYFFKIDHSSYFGKGGFSVAWNYFNGNFLTDEKFTTISGEFLEISESQLNSELILSSDNAQLDPELIFPIQGEKISNSYVDFGWTSSNIIQEYLLYVGYKKGNSTFFKKEQISPSINILENVGWLPLGNEPIFVKFGYKRNDRWYYKYYEYETVSSGLVKNSESKDINENGIGDLVEEQIGQWVSLEDISYNSEQTIFGKDASSFSEGWTVKEDYIYNYKGRGEINFEVQIDEANLQLMSLEFRNHLGHEAINAYDLLFYINDKPIEQWSLKPSDETQFVDVLLPVLSSGNHKLTFFWNAFERDPYFSLERIKLKTLDISESQKQSILGASEKVFYTNIQSEVSPCFIEGISRYKKFVDVSSSFQGNVEVKDSINDRWWADVPLVEGGNDIEVNYQNGAYIENVNIEWVSVDFSLQNNRRIRQGSQMLLSLGESSYGTIKIGDIEYVLGKDQVIAHKFEGAGRYVLEAAFYDENGASKAMNSNIDVISGGADSDYYVVENSYRDINLSLSADLVLDSGKLTLETIEEFKKYSIVLDDAFKNKTFVTRLSQNGPIVNSYNVNGVYYTNTTVRNGVSEVIQILDDETWITKETSFTYKFPQDLRLDVNIFVNGVIFDDGSRFKSMKSDDFSSFGVHDMIILRPEFAHKTTCHQVMIYQGNTRIYRR